MTNYIAYLKHWQGAYDYAMNLDVIGDAQATARNLLTLQGHGLDVVPIYTATADVAELRAMTKDAKYIAYGGLVGVPKRLQIPATKMVVDIAEGNGAKVHALGQTSKQMFDYSNAYSGDSSAVSRFPLVRQLPLYDAKTTSLVSIKIGDKAMVQKHIHLLKEYGLQARPMLDGTACKYGHLRIAHYVAGIVSIARYARALQTTFDQPHIYSSLTTTEGLQAGLIAGQHFQTHIEKSVA